ncbi:metal-sensitive transcriptional regulator [Streptodolium elevatio]|uniref:metal-sensitive transcriptional regulator n=1 Tax=Streptodolium elevatio TaxID=3157996 RepID=UPI003F4CB394
MTAAAGPSRKPRDPAAECSAAGSSRSRADGHTWGHGGAGRARAGSAAARRRGRAMTGYSHQKDDVLKRLRRIEGQVRGLQRMVENDTYCIDVLTQVSAVTRALQSFALTLLDEHMACCVSEAIAGGGEDAEEKVREASAAIARLVRS